MAQGNMNNLPTAEEDPELTEWLNWQLQHGTIFMQTLAELACNADLVQYSILRPALLTISVLNPPDMNSEENSWEILRANPQSPPRHTYYSNTSDANGYLCQTKVVKVIENR